MLRALNTFLTVCLRCTGLTGVHTICCEGLLRGGIQAGFLFLHKPPAPGLLCEFVFSWTVDLGRVTHFADQSGLLVLIVLSADLR